MLRRSLARREAISAYFFIAPNLFGLLVFTLFPVIASLMLSFVKWDILSPWKFIGFENFFRAAKDPMFWRVMVNTAYFTFTTVPLQILFSLLISLILNQQIRGLTVYRTIYFMPTICSSIAIAAIWKWLYEPQFGLINLFLGFFGIQGPPWLGSTKWSMPAVILMNIWRGIGFNMVILLAGLQGIPGVYYEAAKIDGATSWNRFWHITLPLLTPSVFFLTIMGLIRSFQVFGSVYVLTEGGPGDSTRTLVYMIYQVAYMWLEMGYGSSLAWVLCLCLFLMTLIQWKFQGQWVHYD